MPIGVYKRKPKDISCRFWRKVKKTQGCWEWQGCLFKGYGVFQLGRGVGTVLAHRFSFKLAFGTIPKDFMICHKCDNRRCVRPDHLFAGTAIDNNRDMFNKKRHQHGERGSMSKLTEKQVRYIRLSEKRNRDIARELNISESCISQIRNHKAWTHIK